MNDDRDSTYDAAHQAELELQERTELALRHAVECGLPDDDVRLLCYHAGIKYDHISKRS